MLDLLITKYSGEQKTHTHLQNKVLINTTTHFSAVSAAPTFFIVIRNYTQISLVCLVQPFGSYTLDDHWLKKIIKSPFTRQLRLSYKITPLGPNVPKAALTFFSP